VQLHDAVANLGLQAAGAPEPTLIRAYTDSARELCRRALVWRITLPTINSVANQADYTLTPPTDGEIFDVISLKYKDDLLVKATFEQAQRKDAATLNTPKYFQAGIVNKVTLLGAPPSSGDAIVARVNVQPDRNAVEIDDAIVDRWGEVIELGAMARILRMAGQPWTSFDGTRYYTTEFEEKLELARSSAADGDMHGVARKVRYGGL
jgi:hypothetical protein